MTEEQKKQMRETLKANRERKSSLDCKVFSVKVISERLSKEQKAYLNNLFLQSKWYYNYIIAWSKNEENSIFKFDRKIKNITRKDKDGNDIPVEITLPYDIKEAILKGMQSSIKSLSTRKKNGGKIGKLGFIKECNSVNIRDHAFSIIDESHIRLPLMKKPFYVRGLEQILSFPKYELANMKVIRNGKGIYFNITVYIPKVVQKVEYDDVLGVDFGCQTAFVTSEGEKIPAFYPETKRLKRLQKKLARQVKGSNNRYRTTLLLRREYQKITNRKNDMANKIVHEFCKHRTVVIQDEQLQNWHKGGHGKKVQGSILGRVKARLLDKPNVYVLDRKMPTTKLCTNCGQYHDDIKQWNRVFRCDCGIEEDRDIHAAKNMVWMYEHNLGVCSSDVKRVEMEALVSEICKNERSQLLSVKHESRQIESVKKNDVFEQLCFEFC